jgi:hypothetical protein
MKKYVILAIIIFSSLNLFSQDPKKDKKEAKTEKKQLSDGFDSIKWGTTLSDAKKNIRGKIYFTDDKEIIITKDGELEYKYGFFFDRKGTEGKFFYLSVSFPYLAFKDVREKLEAKYGSPTAENINKNQGSIAWDSDKTIIILQVDSYEKKPFTKRIVYVSKEIILEVNEFQTSLFNKAEIETLKKMQP